MTSKSDKNSQKEPQLYREICKARYLAKLAEIDNKDPYTIGKEEWVTDVKSFPDVTYPDIVNYLVNTVSAYTLNEMKGYKSLEAYNYFVCGWVQEVRQTTVSNKSILIGRVRHSQRSTEPCLLPWVVVEKNGLVVSGHCTCMAGLGEICSHVAALLFAVEAAVKIRESKTVTQEKSYWLLPSAVKKVGYKTVQDINFTSAKTMKRQLDTAISCGDTPAPLKQRKLPAVNKSTPSELATFFDAIRVEKPVILSLIPGYAKEYRPAALDKKYPQVLSELYEDTLETADKETVLSRCEEIFQGLKVTQEEAENCELDTRNQATSKQWFRFRMGRITASKMKAACRTSPETPSMSLVKDICYSSSKPFSNEATKWGCQHEKTGKDQYTKEMAGLHEKFEVRDSGLIINPKFPFLGASPDGVGTCECCGEVLLEVKCPFCHKNETITDSIDCLETRDGQLCLKKTHTYYYQVQCQLLLSECEFCDFVIWTTKDFFTQRISLDPEFCEDMVGRASAVFRTAILPELVAKLFSRPKRTILNTASVSSIHSSASLDCATPGPSVLRPVNHSENVNEQQLIICTCQAVYSETDDVIGCDNENCPYVWLHFTCANIKKDKVPKGKWFCKECKPNQKKVSKK